MNGVIQIARDFVGLRTAALELLEGWFADEQRERSSAARYAPNRAALDQSFAQRRSLSTGYYARVDYLFRLTTLDLPTHRLSAEQVLGLRAVEAANNEFNRKHPGCPHCGRPLENAGAFTCWSCRKKVKQ